MLLFTNVVFSKYDFGVHCWSCTSYEKLIKFIKKSKNYLRTFVVKSMLPFHMQSTRNKLHSFITVLCQSENSPVI